MRTNILLPEGRQVWLGLMQGVALNAQESSSTTSSWVSILRRLTERTKRVLTNRNIVEIDCAHEVWVQRIDGQNSSYDLSGFPVDFRAGDTLALVWGSAENVEVGELFGLMNTTTRKYAFEESIHPNRLKSFGLHRPQKIFRRHLLWGLSVGWIIGVSFNAGFGQSFSLLLGWTICGGLVSLPISFIKTVINRRQDWKLIRELNFRALMLLISEVQG